MCLRARVTCYQLPARLPIYVEELLIQAAHAPADDALRCLIGPGSGLFATVPTELPTTYVEGVNGMVKIPLMSGGMLKILVSKNQN
jgi:hypothetical protein